MYNKKNKEVKSKFKDILIKSPINNLSELDQKSILYVAYLEKSNESLDDLEDLDLKFHTKLIQSEYEIEIKKLGDLFSKEELKRLLLDDDAFEKSNNKFDYKILKDGLYKLLVDLLEIEEGDKVADFQLTGFSKIDYLLEKNNYENIDIYEPNMQKVLIYKMKNDILDGDTRIIESNILEKDIDEMYNKILSPIRFNVPTSKEQQSILDKAYPQLRAISKRSDGWSDILSSLLNLEEDGRLVSLVSPRVMYSGREKKIRQYFIDNGFIESVISLPRNLINGISVDAMILVISRKNKNINFIDAKDIYTSINRYEKDLSKENRQDILDLLGADEDNSAVINIEEVKEKDYILDPKRYLNEISFKKEVLLGDVVKRIDRGSNITNKELERYRTEKKTKYRFLNLADIQDGRIKDTAFSLKESLVESNERLEQGNKLKNGQLLLSRTGNPIRFAIVEDIEDEVWFYSGNIYSISLDLNKYNPYYLKVFLESEIGQKILEQVSIGSVIPNISMKDLKEIKLPAIDIEEQNKVADLYLNYEEKIRDKEIELKTLRLARQRDLADILSREEMGLCN